MTHRLRTTVVVTGVLVLFLFSFAGKGAQVVLVFGNLKKHEQPFQPDEIAKVCQWYNYRIEDQEFQKENA